MSRSKPVAYEMQSTKEAASAGGKEEEDDNIDALI